MAQLAMPKHLRAEPAVIVVAQDDQGCWSVYNNQQLMEGAFKEREDALRFARTMRAGLPGSLIVAKPIET